MKTARENVSILPSHAALKRLLDEYESFDGASRLCADYCITADEVALLIDKFPKPKNSRSRLIFAVRSDKVVGLDEAYLAAR
jgi:hypothetical protein